MNIASKFKKGDVLKHGKTGMVYVILETPADGLRLEKTNEPAYCYQELAITDYALPRWVRSAKEMEDGRFVLIRHELNDEARRDREKILSTA